MENVRLSNLKLLLGGGVLFGLYTKQHQSRFDYPDQVRL